MPKGDSTREMIVEQAAVLFNTYGYHGCSLSHIMDATGLRKGGIYNHFKNKDEIALAAFDYAFDKVLKRFRKRLDKDETSTDKLYSILSVFASFVDDPVTKGGCPIVNTAVDAIDNHPGLRDRAREGFNLLEKYITIKIEEGVKSGEFEVKESAEELAAWFVSSLEGAVIISRINETNRHIRLTIGFLERFIQMEMLTKNKTERSV